MLSKTSFGNEPTDTPEAWGYIRRTGLEAEMHVTTAISFAADSSSSTGRPLPKLVVRRSVSFVIQALDEHVKKPYSQRACTSAQ